MVAFANHPQHNYKKKLDQLIREGKLLHLPPGAVEMLDVNHDEWCEIYNGNFCNCHPDIVFQGKIIA